MRKSSIALCSLGIALAASCTWVRTNDPELPLLRLPAHNAYVGTVHALASLRPTFVWEAPAIGVYDYYELQLSQDPAFITGVLEYTSTETRFTLPSAPPLNLAPPVGARYYWRVRPCAGPDGCYRYSFARLVNLGRSDRDFNGDGYSDVVIASPQTTSASPQPGRVAIYFGGPSFDSVVDVQLNGFAPGSLFGVSVSSAGDINADGFSDLIVGASGVDNRMLTSGHAYLYLGGATGITTPFADLVGSGGGHGRTVAAAGDVNGDGFDDVLVGAPTFAEGGRVLLYHGRAIAFDTVADLTYTAGVPGDGFGAAIAAGDVSGDGYSDVLVGAQNHNSGATTPGNNAGRAYLYLGGGFTRSDAIADGMVTGAAGELLGAAVAAAGDLDQDGYADPVIGAPGAAASRVLLFRGSEMSALSSPTSVLSGAQSFGGAVATDGDVDRDGRPELIIGAQSQSIEAAGAGRAYVYAKVPAAGPPSPVVLPGTAASASFGAAVAAAGDVNGDGAGDVVVGAYNFGGIGRAYVYLGSSSGLDPTADWVTSGTSAGDRYGGAVAALPSPRVCRGASARCARRAPR